ncbi:hypothetical protein WA026_009707 [Henosepilachna vigintioctopunctata]|uniref:Uncharacterized protein n=1 Tax=Henosepilachna vigintioctopunctata TaxID=420089 RepID=A0AAW1U4L5_9CUCU
MSANEYDWIDLVILGGILVNEKVLENMKHLKNPSRLIYHLNSKLRVKTLKLETLAVNDEASNAFVCTGLCCRVFESPDRKFQYYKDTERGYCSCVLLEISDGKISPMKNDVSSIF